MSFFAQIPELFRPNFPSNPLKYFKHSYRTLKNSALLIDCLFHPESTTNSLTCTSTFKFPMLFRDFYPDSIFKAISLFINTFQEKSSNNSFKIEDQGLKELLLCIFLDKNTKNPEYEEVSNSFSEAFQQNNLFQFEDIKKQHIQKLFEDIDTIAQENFFITKKNLKYVILMLLKVKNPDTYEILALDAQTLTWVGLDFIEIGNNSSDILVLKYMRELELKCPNVIFVLFSEFFKELNFKIEQLKKNMNEFGLVFIEFHKKYQENCEMIQEGLTGLSTSHCKLPKILSNSAEEIEKIIKEKQTKERFTGAKKAAKRICFLRYQMKKFNKDKGKKCSNNICRVFDFIALGLNNMFILEKKISKKRSSFKQFLSITYQEICSKRVNENNFEISKLF